MNMLSYLNMDLVADQRANGTKFRTLTIVDVFSKEHGPLK